ncbi:hypothetical protein [Roseimaritima ulvae]|uniref:Uncharacterized protein n=1 Tax=Roseimaritima ulvae TaxID=980254 RepID=A0A5B9QNC0_9BACT|nr:hypothetical protein [Roseimaritima ulvae]QEG38975.1 hypothetical protein UC8_09360 [Roseimaritima ulvae]
MALLETNWKPSPRQLRQFGGMCLLMLPLLAWLWSASLTVIAWFAFAGLLIAVVSWVAPKIVAPLFIGLMLITLPIGLVIGELAMFLIYMTVFLPIGIFFRLRRRDRLQLNLDRQCKTYWQAKQKPTSVASYYRQS